MNSDESTTRNSDNDARLWAMFLHLSVLSAFVVPIAGLVVPVVIWQVKKRDLPVIDMVDAAIANEANDSFKGWAALHTCAQVPEPVASIRPAALRRERSVASLPQAGQSQDHGEG